jgi:hypothetical protein
MINIPTWTGTAVLTLALCLTSSAIELDPVATKHTAVAALIKKKCIYLEATGQANLSMDMACGLLGRSDMLETIQQAYGNMLPTGESAEFTIKKEAPGKYSYTNRHNQKTRLEEVAKRAIPNEKALVAIYSEGHRSFGEFRSLVQIEVIPAPEGGVQYQICVYAYPNSCMMRLFAKLPGVERFFKSKTVEMTELSLSICRQIYEQDLKISGL